MPEYKYEASEDNVHNFGLAMKRMVRAYLECAMFTENEDVDLRSDDEYHEAVMSNMEFHVHAVIRAYADCALFVHAHCEVIENVLGACNGSYDIEDVGRDFWYTRNGHGTGFWDRGLPDEPSKYLTAAAKAAGTQGVYAQDGYLWLEGGV